MKSFFHISRNVNPPGCRGADEMHAHSYHELLFCLNGEGGQKTNKGIEPLNAGDLFFYPKNLSHCSVFLPEKTFECYVLDFQSSLFSPTSDGDKDIISILDQLGERGIQRIKLSKEGQVKVKSVLEELYKEFSEKNMLYDAFLKLKVFELLLTVVRDPLQSRNYSKKDSFVSQKQMISEVVQYIEEFYIQCINIETVLRFCPLSRSHFHVVFKRETGKTFNDFLRDTRLEKAKELLKSSDLPVQEISYRCGFSSHAYFTQVFKLKEKTTPGSFRQSLK
ncbi:MAG: AraC family transcriptional regulator [Lentisphaeraceae bacterium]|nr:AraC family transcriptional regulator [Lentisphaeraceae bacterium]